jgi:hypothetical protein
MDTARQPRVRCDVFIQGLQQGIVHARIELAMFGHGRLLQGREPVQHGADRRVLDCCPGSLSLVILCFVILGFVILLCTWAPPRRQRGPGDVGLG